MIESPCKRHCCLDDNNICLGCHRSLEEIQQWGLSDSQAKQAILEKVRQRRRTATIRRGAFSAVTAAAG